ncbi:hypothetical protein [Mycobacterium avium]|uniref:hypothetical protein n=1 Tax=Mycobacterium avium TaxID=1764 RepID=UPI0007A0B94C|nr:hypothetical protein [Mycobacterium avium]
MTVDELRALLAGLPGETPVLVSGYEGGFDPCTLGVIEVQELARGDDQEYLGRFETTAEARRQAAENPHGWISMVGVPVLVGKPVTAVVLCREGR